MLWDACVSRQMLDVIDLKRVVLHRAACAVDALRVEAYAIGYHGNSWAVEVLSIGELAGGGGASYGSSLRLGPCQFAFQSQMTNTYAVDRTASQNLYLELSSVLE